MNNAGEIVGSYFTSSGYGGFVTAPLSTTAKNLGAPPCPNCSAGNPINAAIGNKLHAETDFVGGPSTQLALSRYYNSQDTTSAGFGTAWHSTWHRSLIQSAASV